MAAKGAGAANTSRHVGPVTGVGGAKASSLPASPPPTYYFQRRKMNERCLFCCVLNYLNFRKLFLITAMPGRSKSPAPKRGPNTQTRQTKTQNLNPTVIPSYLYILRIALLFVAFTQPLLHYNGHTKLV
jgi:hypothetical protein